MSKSSLLNLCGQVMASVSRLSRIHQPLRALVLACGSMSYMKRQHQLTLNNHLAHAFYRSLSLSESLKFRL